MLIPSIFLKQFKVKTTYLHSYQVIYFKTQLTDYQLVVNFYLPKFIVKATYLRDIKYFQIM